VLSGSFELKGKGSPGGGHHLSEEECRRGGGGGRGGGGAGGEGGGGGAGGVGGKEKEVNVSTGISVLSDAQHRVEGVVGESKRRGGKGKKNEAKQMERGGIKTVRNLIGGTWSKKHTACLNGSRTDLRQAYQRGQNSTSKSGSGGTHGLQGGLSKNTPATDSTHHPPTMERQRMNE